MIITKTVMLLMVESVVIEVILPADNDDELLVRLADFSMFT